MKKPWQSKTILINAILGLTAALSPFVPALSIVAEFINHNAAAITAAWSVLNIILRAISKDQIVLAD